MKTIRLTSPQRKDISERRRHALDRRIYPRLAADLLGVSTRQVGQWLRIFRKKGLDQLGPLHFQGDPGRLRPTQVEWIEQEIAQGVFHNAEQVRT